MKSAVAYFIYRRPEVMKHSFEAIRKARPKELFIIADGPKTESIDDRERCRRARELTENIDWPCRVYRNYSDSNLGLKRRMETGLDWVFQHAAEALIIEDDCVAHPRFFSFCETLLNRYREQPMIRAISGTHQQHGLWRGEGDYYYSAYLHVWGWAAWEKTWNDYKEVRTEWQKNCTENYLKSIIPDRAERSYWSRRMQQIHSGKIDSWAYPFSLYIQSKKGLCITPNVNLVENVGFGADATHTQKPSGYSGNQGDPDQILTGKLRSPKQLMRNKEADKFYLDHVLGIRVKRFPWNVLLLPVRILRKLRGIKNLYLKS